MLLRWINDTLEGKRIIARDIVEDLYDGQVLGELLSERGEGRGGEGRGGEGRGGEGGGERRGEGHREGKNGEGQ